MCERCSLCKSLSFCPSCHQCTPCCQKSTCGRLSAKILAGLALPGFKSEGSINTERRVYSTLQSETPSNQVTLDSQWLCKPDQTQPPKRSSKGANPKTGGRKGSGFLHQQEGRYAIRLYVYPAMETPVLVQSKGNSAESQTDSGPQIVQAQTGDSEWSLLQEVFNHLCRTWHTLEVDLFATRFNHKLPRFVSLVSDRLAWQLDALSPRGRS